MKPLNAFQSNRSNTFQAYHFKRLMQFSFSGVSAVKIRWSEFRLVPDPSLIWQVSRIKLLRPKKCGVKKLSCAELP